MNNYESGRFVAQKFSHLISKLLQAIYDGTVEPNKPLNDFERGVIDEVKSWSFHSLKTTMLIKMLEKN